MKDKTINCIQCDNPFLLSAAEQERLAVRGFAEPKRCPECRRKKSKNVNSAEKGLRHRDKSKKERKKRYDEYDF